MEPLNLHEIVSQLIVDTKGTVEGGLFGQPTTDSSLGVFLPELVLCATMVLLLFVRLFNWGRKVDAFFIAFLGSGAALLLAAPWNLLSNPHSFARMEIFTGMLVFDGLTVFMRGVLLLFALLFVIFTKLSGIPDREDGPDIYTLVLGSTLGMCLMASANHLLMIFMAVEMASVPSYVLAGMLKGRRVGSEAALKYSIYGAGAAGVMLYGISLIAGLLNTAHLPTMATQLAEVLPAMPAEEMMVLAVGGLLLGVGLAFKLSAFPFHFWCPDVFEGASAEVNAFLSVASKAAALALLLRVCLGLGAIAPPGYEPGERTAVAAIQSEPTQQVYFVSEEADPKTDEKHAAAPAHDDEPADATDEPASDPLLPVRGFIAKLVALIAIVTCTFGNLAAYGQTNIKRLLAYSTIAHAGYMMMAIPPMMVLTGIDSSGAQSAVAALAIYISVYLFMNLGAFAVVAFLRNAMRSEEISDYAGLIRRCPGTVVCLAAMLFSLVGLPPLAGFIGKFAIFAAIADGFQQTGHAYLLVLLVLGGINTAISLFYYLRVIKVMTMDPEPESRAPVDFPMVSLAGSFVFLLTVPTLVLIACWDNLNEIALSAARHLF